MKRGEFRGPSQYKNAECQYRNSYYKGKSVWRTFHFYNGNIYSTKDGLHIETGSWTLANFLNFGGWIFGGSAVLTGCVWFYGQQCGIGWWKTKRMVPGLTKYTEYENISPDNKSNNNLCQTKPVNQIDGLLRDNQLIAAAMREFDTRNTSITKSANGKMVRI